MAAVDRPAADQSVLGYLLATLLPLTSQIRSMEEGVGAATTLSAAQPLFLEPSSNHVEDVFVAATVDAILALSTFAGS